MATKSGMGYDETDKKLSSRINVHGQLAEKDIDPWILQLANVKKGENILDVGCGNGKQVVSFGKVLDNTGELVASDVSAELLGNAKEKAEENKFTNVKFVEQDMDDPFDFKDEYFDLISCCFTIYYSNNPKKLIKEFYRLLKPGGRLFIAGPSPKNTFDFWNLHEKVSNKSVPEKALVRRVRIEKELIPLVKKYFTDVKIEIFDNAIHFKTTDQLMDYYTSSLLFKESYSNEEEKDQIIERMRKEVDDEIEKNSEFLIKKQVYGVIGVKK